MHTDSSVKPHIVPLEALFFFIAFYLSSHPHLHFLEKTITYTASLNFVAIHFILNSLKKCIRFLEVSWKHEYLGSRSIHDSMNLPKIEFIAYTVKSRLSERQLSETTGLFEDYGQSQLFTLLSIAIKLPIIRILVIRKIQFFEVIRRSRLKKFLLNYPSRFKVQNVTHGDHDFFVWSSSIYTHV